MNPGNFTFPRRGSAITSPEDRFAAIEGGGYMTAGETIREGDLFCAHASESGFPIKRGALPAGGVADSVLSAAASMDSETDVESVSAVGLEAGKAMLAFGSSAFGFTAPATVFSGSSPLHDAALLSNGEYVISYIGTSSYVYSDVFSSLGVLQNSTGSEESVVSSTYGCEVAGLVDGGTGNFVTVWTTNSNITKFVVHTNAGGDVSAITTVAASASQMSRVAALVGGGFVVVQKNSTTDIRFSIFDNSGVLQGSSLVIALTGNFPLHGVASLSGGGFVIGYRNASNHPAFAMFDAAGNAVGSPTVIVATASNTVDITGLNDGGFAVAYTNSTSDARVATFDSSGVLSAGPVVITSGNVPIVTCAALPNGDFIVGTKNPSTYPTATKLNANCRIIEVESVVESVNTQDISICPLADNRFVYAYNDTTTTFKQAVNTFSGSTSFLRKDYDGSTLGVLTSIVANPTKSISAAKVRGGGFVVGYQSLSNTPALALFDQDGVLQGSIVTPETAYAQSVAVAALDGGGYVAAWDDSFNSRIRFARYSSAGVLQGAITTGPAKSTPWLSIAPLRSGGFALCFIDNSAAITSTNGTPTIAIYDKAGTQVLAATAIEAVTANFVACDGLTNGDLVAVYNNSTTNVRFKIIDKDGYEVIPATLIETASVGIAGVHGCPGGEFVVTWSVSTTDLKTQRFNQFGEAESAVLVTRTAKNCSVAADIAALNNGDYWSIFGNITDGTVEFARYNSPVVILGAALRSGGEGATLPVKTEGFATLSEDWGGVKTFDHTTATPASGNEGSIFGRTANLIGI